MGLGINVDVANTAFWIGGSLHEVARHYLETSGFDKGKGRKFPVIFYHFSSA
jgi:hypothetical protein